MRIRSIKTLETDSREIVTVSIQSMRILVLSKDRNWLDDASTSLTLHGDVSGLDVSHLYRLSMQNEDPDLLLVHHSVIAREPATLLRKIISLVEDRPVIVTQVPGGSEQVASLLEAGAAGYTREGSDEDMLAQVIGLTLEGITLLDSELARWLTGRGRHGPPCDNLAC